jgi:SPP1 gp7 family putative phage head morphogenesis protein
VNRQAFVGLLRRRGVRSIPRLKRMQQPDMIRLRYFEKIRSTVLVDMWNLVERTLRPVFDQRGDGSTRQDASKDEEAKIKAALEEIADKWAEKWSREKFEKVIQPFAQDIQRFSAAQLNKVLYDIAGVDVVGAEPWLTSHIAAFTRDNVALIRSIPSTFFGEVEGIVTSDIADGVRWEEMSTYLHARFNVSESKATLIARDQTGKFCGKLNEVRQKELGVEGYVWRTMRDNRVRDDHEHRDGQKFAWDKAPPGGHPGEPIQCRCYADPDLEPLLREAMSDDPPTQPPTSTQPEATTSRGIPRKGWNRERVYMVPISELDDIPAKEWEPGRAKAVEKLFQQNVKFWTPLKVTSGYNGLRELDDGNHRLSVARRLGLNISLPVRFLDEDASEIRKRPARPKHFMDEK